MHTLEVVLVEIQLFRISVCAPFRLSGIINEQVNRHPGQTGEFPESRQQGVKEAMIAQQRSIVFREALGGLGFSGRTNRSAKSQRPSKRSIAPQKRSSRPGSFPYSNHVPSQLSRHRLSVSRKRLR